LIPTVHGVDGFRQLRTAAFVNAGCIYPNVTEIAECSLSCAKLKLPVSDLCSARSLYDVSVANFFVIISPGMGKDSVRRYVMEELSKTEEAIGFKVQ
jgi:hypothetical protein